MTPQEFTAEYERLAHAVQTGVMYELERDPHSGTPKHLRVGINTVKADLGAMTRLLIDKGVISMDEAFGYMLDGLREEVKMYERSLSTKYGITVTLA